MVINDNELGAVLRCINKTSILGHIWQGMNKKLIVMRYMAVEVGYG